MILIDTSAWVEFLRGTGSRPHLRVRALLAGDFATCDTVRMEVLAGARDDAHLSNLRGLLARAVALPTTAQHHEHAAALYRTCRRNGETVRKLTDCLIAAVAIGEGVPVLHADQDFTVLARHTALQVHA